MKLCGIDYSYTSPALCVYDTNTEFKFENLKFFNFYMPTRKKGYLDGWYGNIKIDVMPVWISQEERFRNIAAWCGNILKEQRVDEVVLEGYALGSSSGLIFDMAENTSLLKQFLSLNNIKFEKVPPTSVKKIFTGKGNAKKEMMVEEFVRRTGIVLENVLCIKPMSKPIDDLVDSYANLYCHPFFKKDAK